MQKFTKLLLCTASATFLMSSNAWAQTQVGINAAVKGDVKIQSGDAEALQAQVSSPVLLGDGVVSQTESALQVLLNDETTFTVGPDCELVIDKFVYDPSKADGNQLKASVKKGMFRFMSGNISKGNSNGVVVDSPVASMGVRGTMVEGIVGRDAIRLAEASGIDVSGMDLDKDGATIFVLRGPGKKSRGSVRRGEIDVTSNGKTVNVTRSGWATFVGSDTMVPSDPFLMPDNVYELMSSRLRTKVASNAPESSNPVLNAFSLDDIVSSLDISTADIGLIPAASSICTDYFVTRDFFDFDMQVLNGTPQPPDGNQVVVGPEALSFTQDGTFLPANIFLGRHFDSAFVAENGFNGVIIGTFCDGTEPFSPVPPGTTPPPPIPGIPQKPGG